jgi:hypothetical protein
MSQNQIIKIVAVGATACSLLCNGSALYHEYARSYIATHHGQTNNYHVKKSNDMFMFGSITAFVGIAVISVLSFR